jgi:hypothetical protein
MCCQCRISSAELLCTCCVWMAPVSLICKLSLGLAGAFVSPFAPLRRILHFFLFFDYVCLAIGAWWLSRCADRRMPTRKVLDSIFYLSLAFVWPILGVAIAHSYNLTNDPHILRYKRAIKRPGRVPHSTRAAIAGKGRGGAK